MNDEPGAIPTAEPPRGPLAGITVVDLTQVLAGPYCTMLLYDLGARVIKVERPDRGDDARSFGPFVDGRSAYFSSLNRGKESIALDLKEPADRRLFERLLERADVLVENYRPGTMDSLGYGWEMLHERFPRLVYAAASGFGRTGPYAARPAYDMVVQAMGGIMSITGEPGGRPTRVGTSIGDIAAALFLTVGVTSALYRRSETGTGMLVDVAMLDCQVAILENAVARYLATGVAPAPIGARHPSITPFGAFQARDGQIIVAAGNDKLFAQLCAVLGCPELVSDPRFASNDARNENVDALAEELERKLERGSVAEWLEKLQAVGVPCAPLNDIAQVVTDPQVLARNMLLPVDDESQLRVAGNPIKLSDYDDATTKPRAPDLDGDRARIIAELEP